MSSIHTLRFIALLACRDLMVVDAAATAGVDINQLGEGQRGSLPDSYCLVRTLLHTTIALCLTGDETT